MKTERWHNFINV